MQLARDDHVGYMPSEGLSPRSSCNADPPDCGAPNLCLSAPDVEVAAARAVEFECAAIASERSEGKFLVVDGGLRLSPSTRGRSANMPRTPSNCASVSRRALSLGRTHQRRPRLLGARAVGVRGGRPCLPARRRHAGEELGAPLDLNAASKLARGDLVFWDGHVGIMTSAPDRLLHANALIIWLVVEEPLAEARDRISASGLRDHRRAAPAGLPRR